MELQQAPMGSASVVVADTLPTLTSQCSPIRAVAHDPQPRKHSVPRDTLQELLEEARLPQECEAIRAKGDASAFDLAEAAV